SKVIAGVGNDVSLYTTMWPRYGVLDSSCGEGQWASKDVKITIFPAVPAPLNVRLPHSPSLVKAVRNHGREFDMIFVHSLWNQLATFAMRSLRLNKLNYCIMPHGMLDPVVLRRNKWKKLPWSLFWERANIERASLVVFNTNAEEEKARQSGWHLSRTFIMPHTIELSSWKALPPRQEFEVHFPEARLRKVILFVGRINWVKNLDKLVDALELVIQKHPAAMLVCVGPDSDGHRAKIERYAQARGLETHILFTGLLEGQKLKAAYARGDVLALVSQKENFGLAAAEALACGLPVVVSDGVDVARDWPSGGPVRRVAPTPEQIARALLELLGRSADHGLPDLDARLMAEKEFSFPPVLELLDVWQSLKTERV
ncbi:MAG: glycosyltransferase, partial [Desulfobacterales bacterium]|nr:glycosyltransferase [Desulfobacterales bacterium]